MRRLLLALTGVLAMAACACTGGPSTQGSGSTATSSPTPVAIPKVAPGGAPTAAAAIRSLCVAPSGTTGSSPSPSASPAQTPLQIAEVEREVEQARGLSFLHPVGVEAVSDAEMDRRIEESFATSYPKELYARRSVAWATIGVIPVGTDLRETLKSFLTGQVVGFYDPATKELVYLGDGGDLGLTERLVLAHELTHALDDQHFDLSRIDHLAATCQDERFAAALAAVEGDAQYASTEVIAQNPSMDLGDLAQALQQALGSGGPAGVPPFVENLQIWPYTAGQAFITQRALNGGNPAVDATLRDLPTSTEEILHPDLYPGDGSMRVDVPDLTGALGPAWGDLDAMQVGEEWLAEMLAMRMDRSTANDAAAGWSGAVYRAFTDGTHVAVVLASAWDTPTDATTFADAMTAWAGGGNASVARAGTRVTVAFASDAPTLRLLEEAFPSGR